MPALTRELGLLRDLRNRWLKTHEAPEELYGLLGATLPDLQQDQPVNGQGPTVIADWIA